MEPDIFRSPVSGFLKIGCHIIEIIPSVGENELAVGVCELAADFSRDAGHQAAGRNDGVLGDDCAGGDDGALADAGVIEDDGSDADEDGVFDDAAVDCGVVADGDHLADVDGVEVAHAVEDGAVLDIGFCADADGVDVAADDGVHPDAGVLTEDDVADDLCAWIDVASGRNDGGKTLIGTDHFSP